MPDIDTAFDDLRREIAQGVVGPDTGQIIRRARRRTRIRLATVAAAAIVAAGGVVTVGGAQGDDGQRILTPPSPTASRPAQPRPVKLADLIYGTTADRNRDRGVESDLKKRWLIDYTGNLRVPGCSSGDLPERQGLQAEGATVTQFDLHYNGNREPGNEATSTSRAEQVLVFADVARAQRLMDQIDQHVGKCKKGMTLKRPAIGERAISVTIVRDPDPIPQTERAVIVRQGSVVAFYWDMHNNGPESATLADHERDARKMVQRLSALGYHG